MLLNQRINLIIDPFLKETLWKKKKSIQVGSLQAWEVLLPLICYVVASNVTRSENMIVKISKDLHLNNSSTLIKFQKMRKMIKS